MKHVIEEVSFNCNQNFDQDFVKDIGDAPEVIV